MGGMFVPAAEVVREKPEWGALGWCCRPSATGSKDLAVIEVTFAPGGAHAFHKHPRQEEVIYVIEGQVEQWLDQERRLLCPGDCVFIPPGVVHASFCAGQKPAKLLAILGPCVGRENGYEVVEVADQPPWNSIRG